MCYNLPAAAQLKQCNIDIAKVKCVCTTSLSSSFLFQDKPCLFLLQDSSSWALTSRLREVWYPANTATLVITLEPMMGPHLTLTSTRTLTLPLTQEGRTINIEIVSLAGFLLSLFFFLPSYHLPLLPHLTSYLPLTSHLLPFTAYLLPLFQVMYKSSSIISLNKERKSPKMNKSLPKKFLKT